MNDDYTRELRERNADLAAENAKLRDALRNLLAVENKAWPTYVRQEFATARALLKEEL